MFGFNLETAVPTQIPQPEATVGIRMYETIANIIWVVTAVFALILFFLIARKIINYIRIRKEKTVVEMMLVEALKNEATGNFVSAGVIYEQLKNYKKAAELFEKGKDYKKAADIYQMLNQADKAKEAYVKAGDLKKAADMSYLDGDYTEAAKFYNEQGDKISAAKALEKTGNRLAAIRAYREAGDYVKAAILLRAEGMKKEAAEMYGISLAGQNVQNQNIEKFYAHASLLEEAGEQDKAVSVYEKIHSINPNYKNVKEKIKTPSIQAKGDQTQTQKKQPETDNKPRKNETALKNMFKAERLEPKNTLKLWVQILRELNKKHLQDIYPENIAIENVFIDTKNNVRFDENAPKSFAYTAPEKISGEPADSSSNIYAMGVVLFEMLTGSLDSLGIKKPSEVLSDIPSWLEEIALKCIEKDRDKRYRNLDEIFSAIKSLKNLT